MGALNDIFMSVDRFTVPLVLCLFVELGLLINRSYRLRAASLRGQPFLDQVRESVRAGRLPDALALASAASTTALGHVVKEGLLCAHQSPMAVRATLQAATFDRVRTLSWGRSILLGIGSLAVLYGLLGTVFDMFPSFHCSIGGYESRAAGIARGISLSMSTTILGLIAGTVALAGRMFLDVRLQAIEAQLEHASAVIFNLLCPPTQRL